MILSALMGGEVNFTCLSDVVSMTFSLGFDVALLVFFLNHFFDFFASGGRYR